MHDFLRFLLVGMNAPDEPEDEVEFIEAEMVELPVWVPRSGTPLPRYCSADPSATGGEEGGEPESQEERGIRKAEAKAQAEGSKGKAKPKPVEKPPKKKPKKTKDDAKSVGRPLRTLSKI